MARILVTEEIAEGGLDRLRAAGHEVDVRSTCRRTSCSDAVAGAHALIIRSATNVTDEVLAAGPTCWSSAGPASASTTSTSRPPARAA